MRRQNSSKTGKLSIKKETMRKLQLRTLGDDELIKAAGGAPTGACSGPAPSIIGQC